MTRPARPAPRPPARGLTSRPLLAFVAAVVVGSLVAVVVVATTHGSSPRPAAAPASAAPAPTPTSPPRTDGLAWKEAALQDFKPLKGVLIGFTKSLAAWEAGTQGGKETATSLDYSLPEILRTRAALAVRTPFAKAPRALDDYRLAVALYVQAARVARVGTTLPDGPLADQSRRAYGRLRNLADRVFDQADAELSPYLPSPPVIDGVTFVKPAEVPRWSSLGLAAGPPLDAAAPRTAPRSYEEHPQEQSFADFAKAVRAAGVPGATELATAVSGGSTAELRTLADRFTTASDLLYDGAVPRGERVVGTRVELGLLVDADSARTAELASLVAAPGRTALTQAARALAVIGDALWDDRLGPRSSGLPAALLSA
ncbi:MAG: hypothetical protein ACXVFV_12105 [Mycobacteriales bacterium]